MAYRLGKDEMQWPTVLLLGASEMFIEGLRQDLGLRDIGR